tara:strand:+ start:2468 stop:3334 length:867 start_codon:yes stop_codon:yes gene_type:complete
MAYNEPIDVWRMSCGRPDMLLKTTESLHKHLKYRGELRFHLIEAVLVKELSEQCMDYMHDKWGYLIHKIEPAKGQGYSMQHALNYAIKSKYSVKWEDDFLPEVDIPLNDCVDVMEAHSKINQISFNKRETMKEKICSAQQDLVRKWGYKIHNIKGDTAFFGWPKEQRYFELEDSRNIPMVVKEKWWFGSSIFRVSFIKPLYKWWDSNTHNLLNDEVLLPMAGACQGTPPKYLNKKIASPKQIEEHIGCYIFGKVGDKRMVFHAGIGASLWNGEQQKKWKAEGRTILGI